MVNSIWLTNPLKLIVTNENPNAFMQLTTAILPIWPLTVFLVHTVNQANRWPPWCFMNRGLHFMTRALTLKNLVVLSLLAKMNVSRWVAFCTTLTSSYTHLRSCSPNAPSSPPPPTRRHRRAAALSSVMLCYSCLVSPINKLIHT